MSILFEKNKEKRSGHNPPQMAHGSGYDHPYFFSCFIYIYIYIWAFWKLTHVYVYTGAILEIFYQKNSRAAHVSYFSSKRRK